MYCHWQLCYVSSQFICVAFTVVAAVGMISCCFMGHIAVLRWLINMHEPADDNYVPKATGSAQCSIEAQPLQQPAARALQLPAKHMPQRVVCEYIKSAASSNVIHS